jgi:hypothetical protein
MEAARDNEIATKLAEKYKKAFGIDYQIVSASEAAVILQNSPTPYSMDIGAFFYNNNAYFVKGQFTAKNVLHEFAHPLIKGIAFQNPKFRETFIFNVNYNGEMKLDISVYDYDMANNDDFMGRFNSHFFKYHCYDVFMFKKKALALI